jgi:hypothetical protein
MGVEEWGDFRFPLRSGGRLEARISMGIGDKDWGRGAVTWKRDSRRKNAAGASEQGIPADGQKGAGAEVW